MSIDSLNGEQLNNLENELLKCVPLSGNIGNLTLQTKLKWDLETYWFIRNRLIDKGHLETGRGKGGSVKRIFFADDVETSESTQNNDGKAAFFNRIPESDLYEPLLEVIKEEWANDHRFKDHRFNSCVVEITAKQGARDTGGKWSRPDITLASYTTYPYVPGKHFDVITFEIKPSDAIDVTAVYEALAHRRAATKSYVLLHIPDESSIKDLINDICEEAKRYGIGVIIVGNPENYESWEEKVEASRHEPDPTKLNDFLSKQVSQAFKEQINRWFR